MRIGSRVFELRIQHAVVPPQRRVAVDQRDRDGRLLDRLATAEDDVAHGKRVARVDARDDVAHEHLVGEGERRIEHVEVTAVEGRVVGIRHYATDAVDRRERLCHLREVAVVGQRRVATNIASTDERRAVHAREHHVIATDVHVVGPVARLQVELARCLGDLGEDELRVKEDLVALHALSVSAEQLESLGLHELDAQLGHDATPALVEDRHRVGREDLVTGHVVDEHGQPLVASTPVTRTVVTSRLHFRGVP